MPVVSTDDQARRLRYIYLGPVGLRFPFEARFPAIGLWAVLTATMAVLSYALSPPGTRLWVVGLIVAPLVSLLVARRVMQHVDHDRPLRWWIGTVITAELSTPRPLDDSPTTFEVTAPTGLYTPGRAA